MERLTQAKGQDPCPLAPSLCVLLGKSSEKKPKIINGRRRKRKVGGEGEELEKPGRV